MRKRNNPSIWLIGVASLALFVSGCTTAKKSDALNPQVDLVAASYAATDVLISKLPLDFDKSKAMISTSIVNIDNLEGSSSLGRILAEQITSRFSQQSYTVVEMKLRKAVFIKQGAGEFMLSREVRNISKNHDAQAVIVGSYAVGQENIYMTIRVVRTPDSIIVASHDFRLPLSPDLRTMLRNSRRSR